MAALILPAGTADPLPFLNTPRIGPTGITLTFTGKIDQTYSVLGSTNLNNWSVLGTAGKVSSNLFRFTDEFAPPTRRFYRLTSP